MRLTPREYQEVLARKKAIGKPVLMAGSAIGKIVDTSYDKMMRRAVRKTERQRPAMETMISLPYPPSLNNLYATVNGRRVLSREGKRYKETVARQLMANSLKPIKGAVSFEMHAFMPDRRRRDLSNLCKITEDALTGFAWVDDSQIDELFVKRHHDHERPRLEVFILELLGNQA